MESLARLNPEEEKALVALIDRRIEEKFIDRFPSREDFSELKSLVRDLVQAQNRTEKRVEELTQAQKRTETRMEELTQAQKLTETRMEELTQAQKLTETRMEDLAQAQKRTETRMEELAQAQKRTETRVEQLAGAQTRTEQELRLLASEHRKTRDQVGGLSTTVGYRLEDEAFKALPELLRRDHGLEVEGRLTRRFVEDRQGKSIEINIYGLGRRNGKRVVIFGEAKSQLSKKGVNEFLRRKMDRFTGVFEEMFPVLVTYMISEYDVEEYAKSKGIAVYYSYDF